MPGKTSTGGHPDLEFPKVAKRGEPELAVSMSKTTYWGFPPPPRPDVQEYPGGAIGLTNVITRTKGRTPRYDKTIDREPGMRDRLVGTALANLGRNGTKAFTHDVVIHGIRVRAVTTSAHLGDFWVDKWHGVSEWERLTGVPAPEEPSVMVYALTGVPGEDEAAYYSRATNTIVFFNTAYYGQLKSWVLGAVGRILAEEYGIHSIHGACAEAGGQGILYIAPTGTGKSTLSYGLMRGEGTRFHSDDWVYIRYTYRDGDGRPLAPRLITEHHGEILAQGFRVFHWLESHAGSQDVLRRAHVKALTLDNREVEVSAREIDMASLEAYAYTSEKVFYLRTNLAESFPESAAALFRAKLENVPDVEDMFLSENAGLLEKLAGGPTPGSTAAGTFRDMARLIAFDNARGMLDITKLFGPGRVFVNPLEPTRLGCVMLLKRDFECTDVLLSLSLDEFMGRLLIGETPEKKKEIAYNAYRAVDDGAELKFMAGLERESGNRSGLYRCFLGSTQVIDTLEEEFELFRILHGACRCYDVNTVLQADPDVRDKNEAVRRTIGLVERVIASPPPSLHLTLADYASYLGPA